MEDKWNLYLVGKDRIVSNNAYITACHMINCSKFFNIHVLYHVMYMCLLHTFSL